MVTIYDFMHRLKRLNHLGFPSLHPISGTKIAVYTLNRTYARMRCIGVRVLKSCVQARNSNSRRTFIARTYCQWPTKLYGLFVLFYYLNGTL